jgi:hypothetical protein
LSVFKKRGLPIEIVTTEVTEFDVALYAIPDARLEEIGASLKAAPLLRSDIDLAGARVRTLKDYAVAFLVTSDDERILITVANIQPATQEPRLEVLLRGVGIVAMLRGATGL